MGQFTLTLIKYEGEIKAEIILGVNAMATNIVPKVEKQDEKTVRISISCNLSQTANEDKDLTLIRVTTLYTFFNINVNQLEKEAQYLNSFVIRSFSHLQAIIYSKFQDAKTPAPILQDPNFQPAIEKLRNQFFNIFKT